MKTIWKYEINLSDTDIKLMPVGAEVLSVANQNGTLCLWALVDPQATKVPRVFEVIGTGNPVDGGMGVERQFIGTVLMAPFVWHVFEAL